MKPSKGFHAKYIAEQCYSDVTRLLRKDEIRWVKVFAYASQFDRLWSECPTVERRKEFLRTFLHQVTVDHSAEKIKATYYVYKVPLQREALAASGLTPLTARVTCGGRI